MKKISRPSVAPLAAHQQDPNSSFSGQQAVTSSPLRGYSGATAAREIAFEDTQIPARYPQRLSLYLQAPDYEISIEDFESLALTRLEMLKAVETAGIRNLKDDDLIKIIRKHHTNLHGNSNPERFPLFDERRRDEASHFILRLAFCGAVPNDTLSLTDSEALNGAEEGRRWFVNQEVALLRYRLQVVVDSSKEREEFISNSLRLLSQASPDLIRQMDAEEKLSVIEQLRAIHSPDVLKNDEFYNVAWELVPDLVAKRAVLLHRGRAFVPRSECTSIVLNRFKEELELSLEAIAREIPFLRDDRIVPLLDALRRCDYSLDAAMSSSSSTLAGQLSAADIDKTSAHFPPCMQNLHRNLRADRHLKFSGRQQFGLFLKSIGLSLSEALIFWRTAFLPKHSADQFNKEYAYNVRHNYGQEGKRANYSSYSCGKICSGSVAPGEYHGCPFKQAGSTERLSSLLTLYTGPGGAKLTPAQIGEVAAMAGASHFQSACTRVFEFTRPVKAGGDAVETVTYPHKFYEASVLACAPKKSSK